MSKTGAGPATDKPDDYYWFTPKHHGYGAVPRTWRGWLAMGGFSILVPLLTVPFLMGVPEEHRVMGFAVWAGAVGFMVWRFCEFVKTRTNGEWLWRHKGMPYKTLLGIDDVQGDKKVDRS